MLRRSHAQAQALSLVLGAGSALRLHAAARGQTRPPTPVPVVAVTRAVSATQTLGTADLRVMDLPPQAVPAGAIRVLSQAKAVPRPSPGYRGSTCSRQISPPHRSATACARARWHTPSP